MKKKTIVIIISVVIAFIILCGVGYTFFSEYINNVEKRGFVEEAQQFLEQDEEFLSEYGKILLFETNDEYPPNKIENDTKTEYYMTFECETEKAILQIQVFHVYDNGWSHRYEILNISFK